MTIDEIAEVGTEIVKEALLSYLSEYGVRSLTVNHYSDGPQIRFGAIVGGKPQMFAVDVEPFVLPGSANG